MQRPAAPTLSPVRMPVREPQTVSPISQQLQQRTSPIPRGLAALVPGRVLPPSSPLPQQGAFRMPLIPVLPTVPVGLRMPHTNVLPTMPTQQLAGIKTPLSPAAQHPSVGIRITGPLGHQPNQLPIFRRHTPNDPTPGAPQQTAPETVSAPTFNNNSVIGRGGFGVVTVKLVSGVWVARKSADPNHDIQHEVSNYKILQSGQVSPYLLRMLVC